MFLEARGETEDDSAPKSAVEKPPSPKMSARDTEEMADAVFRNSLLPDAERSDEKLLEGSGSDKLPEGGGDEKLPEEEGDEKLPEETPTGKLMMPCTDRILPSLLAL